MKSFRVPGYWRIEKKIKSARMSYLSRHVSVPPLENYLLFSDPRGGSTWLAEIVRNITQQPIIWEPLHLKVKEFKVLNFGWRQYIPEDETWPEANKVFDQLFSGKLLNDWLISETRPKELLKADHLIIKFCRGNMLLPYLTRHYNFKNKPIHLIRHPFAVVSSQLKHGAWGTTFKTFSVPDIPYNEIYVGHKEFLSSLTTQEEVLTATWCITNQVPLNNSGNNKDWITINYETLLLEPKSTMERVLNEWNIDCDLDTIQLTKKSFTTKKGSPVSGKEQLSYWKNNLSEEQISRMKDVLTYFNVKEYSDTVEPLLVYN